MRIFGSLCLLLLWSPMPAAARDIFVDNVVGNDRAAGRQPRQAADGTGPVRTIREALGRARTSDTIVLANTRQPYRESISVVGSCRSGTAEEPFTIRGNGAILERIGPRAADGLGTLWRGRVSLPPATLGLPATISR